MGSKIKITKKNQHNFVLLLCVTLVILALWVSGISAVSFFGLARAQSVGELKDKRSDLQQQLDDLNRQIKSLQTEISKTRSQQASLKNEILIYDREIKATELQIQAKETQIQDANLQIAELQAQIEKRLKEIADNKVILGQLLVQLNELDADTALHIGLGSESFSQFLDQIQFTQSLQGKVYEILQNVKAIKLKLEAQQADLKAELKKLEALRDQLAVTQESLQGQRRQKQSLLDKTRGVERNYQSLLAKSQSAEADLQKEILDLDNSIRAKLGQRTISPGKGVLAYPMDGILTQGYGNTGFTALGYTFHNGIDLAAPAGEPVYAAADGAVAASDTGEAAYGNWVAIKHKIATKDGPREVISLYAHLRSIRVSAGQSLRQGDLVGFEGNTGNTTRLLYGPERGYHLHFTVFDAEGFGVAQGAYTKIYGPYTVPFGYTYNPLDFLN